LTIGSWEEEEDEVESVELVELVSNAPPVVPEETLPPPLGLCEDIDVFW